MTLATQLWEQHRDLADASLLHPFVQGLGDGSLSRARYTYYIAQDIFYLEAFARAYALAGVKAPTWVGFQEFHALTGAVLHEMNLHRGVMQEMGIDLSKVEVGDATRRYTDFLLATAWGQDVGLIAAAMAPCMQLYVYIGQQLAREQRELHAYTAWIENYSNPEMVALIAHYERLMEEYTQPGAAASRAYRYAMQCEYDFFDAAWNVEA